MVVQRLAAVAGAETLISLMVEGSPAQRTPTVVASVSLALRQICDRVDLGAQTLTGQAGHLHGGARGPMVAEHARVDAVHLRELPHVDQEDAAAQDVLQAGARGLE